MKLESTEKALAEAFESLSAVPQPNKGRQTAQRAIFLGQAHEHHQVAVPSDQYAHHGQRRGTPPQPHRLKRLAMVGALVAMILALVVGTGGVIYAADEAAPGDPLYSIDQIVESVRLSLAGESQIVMGLLLSMAEERLQEAETLSGKGDGKNLDAALNGYGEAISSLAQELGSTEVADTVSQAALLDEAFSNHETYMARIFEPEGEEETAEESQSPFCAGEKSHPVAERLAEAHGVPVEEIRRWSCEDGLGFGEIMHALQTSEATGVDPQELHIRKTKLGGWGQVWQELGLIGPPDNLRGGPPDDAGPPDGKPVGPPEDKPNGPPDGRPVGPPEDKPGGPPDGRPVGPPEDKPGGPPEGKPGGPPDDEPSADKQEKEKKEDDAKYCVGVDVHPVGRKLAKTYDVLYEDIMRWFCEGGYGFGEIRRALETSAESGVPAGELLEQ